MRSPSKVNHERVPSPVVTARAAIPEGCGTPVTRWPAVSLWVVIWADPAASRVQRSGHPGTADPNMGKNPRSDDSPTRRVDGHELERWLGAVLSKLWFQSISRMQFTVQL